MIKEFFNFLKKYGILGLAIAVILGGKLNNLVSSLVNDLIMPLVFAPALRIAKIDDIKRLSYHGILYGKVIGNLVDFVIVAFLIFAFSKYILKEDITPKI